MIPIFTALSAKSFILLDKGCQSYFFDVFSDGSILVVCNSLAYSIISPTPLISNLFNCYFWIVLFYLASICSLFFQNQIIFFSCIVQNMNRKNFIVETLVLSILSSRLSSSVIRSSWCLSTLSNWLFATFFIIFTVKELFLVDVLPLNGSILT